MLAHMSRREPPEATLRAVARRHKPRGWRVIEGRADDGPLPKGFESAKFQLIAYCDFINKIIKHPKINSRWGLYVFLHECGHAHLQTEACWNGAESVADLEVEAERYAIAALRASGIPVPRDVLIEARRVIKDYVDKINDAPSDDALLFAGYR